MRRRADSIRPRDTVSFFCAGAAGRPGYPGGICWLVRPSGGRFFPLVRKESEERHAKGKGFAQSRPSLWNPILRNLRAALALTITVREPGLRPCRAIASIWECRCACSTARPVGNGPDRSAKRTGLRRTDRKADPYLRYPMAREIFSPASVTRRMASRKSSE
jgi:hypothetical protein